MRQLGRSLLRSLVFSGLTLVSLPLRTPALAGTVPLSAVQPARAHSDWPMALAAPARATLRMNRIETPEQEGLRFSGGSQTTYAVPTGQNTFSGVLVYEATQVKVPRDESVAYTEAFFRILLDGKVVFERGMSRPQPPLEFSVPLAGARELTVWSRASAASVTVSLARAQFSSSAQSAGSWFLPASGAGYVDCTPLSRQGVVGAFFPGETVPISATFTGQAAQANVVLQFTPADSNVSPLVTRFPVRLDSGPSGVVQGTGSWRVPSHQGPGKLVLDEEVNGQNVFHQEMRVAVIPPVDLSKISSSPFGVHISGSGYPLVWDEFAYLWGAKWGRLFVRWPVLEPSQGQFDFSRIDSLVGLYQSQKMLLLVALGEDAPAWAGPPGTPGYMAAWKEYLAAVVKHFAGKVEYWDVFNEVDSKYGSVKGEPNWDIEVLRTALQTIHTIDPAAKTVCCSTGTSAWLQYDKRIFDAGLLNGIDIVSLHPYSPFAPERKNGLFTYSEAVNAPRDLARSYGAAKPVWSTEANWIIGPVGNPIVTAPGVNEEMQAKYVVRVNLISFSAGVPYFLHAPFVTGIHPQIQLETLAGYAEMASLLSGAGKSTMMASGPDLWGFYSSKGSGYVGALWGTAAGSQIRLGGGNFTFLDMYGNSLRLNPDSITLSQDPIYFLSASAPQFQILRQVEALRWRPIEAPARWTCSSASKCLPLGGGGTHVVSSPSKYGYQLTSPPIAVNPQTCQTFRIKVNLKQGAAGIFAVDGTTGKMIGKVVYANFVPDGQAHDINFNLDTASATAIKLVVANANSQDSVSDFYLADPAIANCE
jgi:hypothetical protein